MEEEIFIEINSVDETRLYRDIPVLKEQDIIATKVGNKYYCYHILHTGEIQRTNIQYELKT